MIDLADHTARTYLMLSRLENTVTAAHQARFESHARSLKALEQAASLIQSNLDERKKTFDNLTRAWEKTRLPKGLSTPEKKFFWQQDRARHFAFRRPDMTYLTCDEEDLGLENYLAELKKHQIDFIVLAGFLWKLPAELVSAYPGSIINIHPALLPNYGGKGMYGNHVHEAVIAAGDKESGITIHYVDEQYDHGKTILQATCPVEPADTPASLAQKIHALEHLHYPKVISEVLQKQNHR